MLFGGGMGCSFGYEEEEMGVLLTICWKFRLLRGDTTVLNRVRVVAI